MGAAVARLQSDIAADIRAVWQTALRPEEPLSVAEWAERYRRLDGKSASEPGKWRNARTPYLVQIMETLSTASRAEIVVFQKGSQIGATETGNNWLGYLIDHAPGPALVVWPTVDIAKRNSMQRIDALIDSTPRLAKRVAPARERDSGNTRLLKEFPGGVLVITGANSAASLKSTPARYLFLDEIDEYPIDLGRQGSAVTLALRATRTYRRRRKVFLVSTPTREGTSRIDAERRRAEQEWRYHVPCPSCGHLQELVWDRIRYTVPPSGSDSDGALVEIPDVTYECVACSHRIAEHYKQQLLERGQWVCIRNRGERSVAFHLSALYSPPGWFGWGEAAAMYERAKQQPNEMQPFQNTVLGLPYADQHDAPDWQPLFDRREAYPIGTVPPGGRFLTMAVDVQRDRLEVEVKAWGRAHQSWSIVHEVLVGDPSQPVIWRDLDQLLALDWPCTGGGTLPILCCAIDSGDLTQHVYAWARQHTPPSFGGRAIAVHHPRTVMVVKGRNIWGRMLLPPERVSADERQRGLRVVGVGVSGIKRELYTWMRGSVGKDGTAPHGYLHYPAYEQAFFRQLTAERMVVRARHGYPTEYWEKDPGARNEALDLAVYSRAAAAACGIDRMTPVAWQRMETQVPPGLLGTPYGPGMEAVAPPAAPVRAPVPTREPEHRPVAARSSWLTQTMGDPAWRQRMRSGGW